MQLNLNQIRLDGGTQPRAEIRFAVVDEYAELMRDGVEFPPVVVFHDGTDYWLADGFHRVAAAKRARPDQPIDVEIHQGTQSDAQWYSYGVNTTHGLRRTNEDKRRAVMAALSHTEGAKLSDVKIAEHCGVSHTFVAKLRGELSATCNGCKSPHRTGRDGRKINTAKIGSAGPHGHAKKHKGIRISPHAHTPIRGHSAPCPMIPLTFSPNNPQTAAAALWQLFPREFVVALVNDLSVRLNQQGDSV
ncbi:MAG: hypothetical protein DCC68_23265 [Planctomycetota bacterium]|nr:MAG: hypothetical protein DCC68_23265 [Planctomycetota bacterium]